MLAMPRTVKALHGQPDMGFLHAKLWGVRIIIMVQYWRSMAQLLACVHDRDSAQLPALRAFNKAVGTDGARGIWHETCAIKPVQCENVYGNMPLFGLGRAGQGSFSLPVVRANRRGSAFGPHRRCKNRVSTARSDTE